MKKKLKISMEVIHAHAAVIDIGSKSHWVAVDQNPQHVREFGAYTKGHLKLIEHLRSFQVTTVAMERTDLIGKYYLTHFSRQDSMLFWL